MTPLLLVSHHVIDLYGEKLSALIQAAPRGVALLPFTQDLQVTPSQLQHLEAAFFSYEIWNGTIKSQPSAQSAVFWSIVNNAPNLKWLQVFSAGADQARYQSAFERGVRVTSSAGTNGVPVGLTAVAGLLGMARGFAHWTNAQRLHRWGPLAGEQVPRDLRGQTVVVVGTGIIGTTIARALSAVGMRTIGIRRSSTPAAHFDQTLPLEKLDAILPAAEWLVLAGPLTPETRSLIDAHRLALLPRGAGLVNVSRGEILDEAATVSALGRGHLRCAYIDVFTVEPLPVDSAYWTAPNVWITPHNAAVSAGNFARGVDLFLRNLEAYLQEHAMENEVVLR